MADEKKETEEAIDSAIAKGDEETKGEIAPEVMESMKKFDEMIDSDDDDTATDDTTSDDDKPEEETDEEESAKTKPTVEEEADEQAAEDKEIEAAAKTLEDEIKADEVKPPEKKVEPVAKVEVKADEKAEDDKPFDCGLDPEEYDGGYIEAVNKIGQDFKDENKAVKQENEALKQAVAQQISDSQTDWMDRRFSGLGENFTEVFGEGDIDDVEPGSEQFENRSAVSKRIGLVAQAYQKLGKPIPSRNKLFDKAVAYLHKTEINKSKTDEKTSEKLAERKAQVIGKGSNKGSTLSAIEVAKQVQKKFDKKVEAST